MADEVYKMTQIVGSSKKSFAEAADKAVRRAAKTLRGLSWFEVKELRGRIEDGKIMQYQVKMDVGFTLEG